MCEPLPQTLAMEAVLARRRREFSCSVFNLFRGFKILAFFGILDKRLVAELTLADCADFVESLLIISKALTVRNGFNCGS